jgi:hypothetical protein
MYRKNTFELEYHSCMRRSVPASLACFGILSLPLFLSSSSPAQSNNASSSAHSMSAAPPTGAVTPYTGAVSPPTGAFVHNGFAPSTGFVPSNTGAGHTTHWTHSPGSNHAGEHHRHSSDSGGYYVPYLYYYGVPSPYMADNDADTPDNQNDPEAAEYQGGPTIFDRRGLGVESYVPPVSDRQTESLAQNSAPVTYADDDPPQPPTSLVFKDGHQVQVANYAIVSQTLYDLTPGHHRKIALADLDLAATVKQNDDQGVTFQLPPNAQAN